MATGDPCLSEHSVAARVSKVVHLQRPPPVGVFHKMSFHLRVRMRSLKIARQHLHDELPDIKWTIKRVIPSIPRNINWDIFSGISVSRLGRLHYCLTNLQAAFRRKHYLFSFRGGKHFPFQRHHRKYDCGV